MKPTSHSCDPQRLRRLLDDDLPDAQRDSATRHVDDCPACQQTLDALAADATWWTDAQRSLGGVGRQADQYCDTAAAERSARFARRQARPGDVNFDEEAWERDESLDPRAVSLTFLAPSDNPAMLGRLGEFEILELIGSGGMGIVLKGYDHELNRFVAVKVLHPHCATSGAGRRRFVREAQAAAAVVHPHVIAIHAVDAQHQPPYLVMPFVPGESLHERLRRLGPLDLLEVLRIGQQIAEGLAAAHAQGLIHRDIKPANILLERNVDRVVITDFGLARAADDASLTRSGVIAGTPPFMSPEQARGESLDPRTDLFSLGCVFYMMLTGHSPFRAESSLAILRRVCEEQPRRLREVRPDCPEWLETLVGMLLAKRADERPESARQVAQWCAACLAHCQHPTQFVVPEELERDGRRRRFVRRWSAIGAASLVAVAGISTLPLWLPSAMNSSPTTPSVERRPVTGSREMSSFATPPSFNTPSSETPFAEPQIAAPQITETPLGEPLVPDSPATSLENLSDVEIHVDVELAKIRAVFREDRYPELVQGLRASIERLEKLVAADQGDMLPPLEPQAAPAPESNPGPTPPPAPSPAPTSPESPPSE